MARHLVIVLSNGEPAPFRPRGGAVVTGRLESPAAGDRRRRRVPRQ